MTRQHHPFFNPATGLPECLYAGCGKEIPADHFLCKRHYFQLGEGLVEPCPGLSCTRFKSVSYDFCAVCSKHLAAEDEPQWAAGDEGCSEFFTYLLVSASGEWYAGHTRDLRVREWLHRHGGCQTTSGGDYRLAWFEAHPSRSAAADRELELKRQLCADRYAVIRMALEFQDNVALVRPMGDVVRT